MWGQILEIIEIIWYQAGMRYNDVIINQYSNYQATEEKK